MNRAALNRAPLVVGDQAHAAPLGERLRDAAFELTVVGSVCRAVGDLVAEGRAAGENMVGHAAIATVDNHCSWGTRIVRRASIASVSFAVTVAVLLKRVGNHRAIIGSIRNAISVGIRR